MRISTLATLLLAISMMISTATMTLASPYWHHYARHSFHRIYPGALHYAWRWVRVPTAVGAPTGGAPVYYYGGGYLPRYGAAYPYYSAGYAPGYGCSIDYHFEDGFCYPN